MKKIFFLVAVIFCFQIIKGQEYAHLLGGDFNAITKILMKDGDSKIEPSHTKAVDGQRIKSLRLIVSNKDSFSREVTFLFISDVCISQLYKLHFEKARSLIAWLDTTLVKSPVEDFTWSKPNTYVDLMYQIKKIPPDHVLTVWLDVRNSLIN